MQQEDHRYTARLARLRAHDSSGQYAGGKPTTATDSQTGVGSTIDPTNRVVGTHVTRLTDDLRHGPTLATAVDRAYRAAVLTRMAASDSDDRRRREPPTARQASAEWIPLDDILESGREFVPPDFHAARNRRRTFRADEGISRNECVTVVLDLGGSNGSLTFDNGWLRQAEAANVASAITQAFQDAYRKRDAS